MVARICGSSKTNSLCVTLLVSYNFALPSKRLENLCTTAPPKKTLSLSLCYGYPILCEDVSQPTACKCYVLDEVKATVLIRPQKYSVPGEMCQTSGECSLC